MSDFNLDKILTIAGRPGLFRMVAQTRKGVIAASISDQKKIITNIRHQVNLLSEIRVFGLKDELPINDVFERIYQLEKGQPASIKSKASKE